MDQQQAKLNLEQAMRDFSDFIRRGKMPPR
jgi:hypothetical protein